MAFFTSNVDAALRQFNSDIYEDAAFRNHVLMGIFGKKAMYGSAFKQPIATAYTAGVGGTFGNAQTNESDVARSAFLVTPNQLYALQSVPNTDVIFSESKEGAVVELLSDAIEKSIRACGDQFEQALFGDGSGTIGNIGSNTGGGPYVLTLSVVSDAMKFYPGLVLVSKATAFAAALDTGTATVTAVSRSAGTVTVSAAGGWTPTNTHVLGIQGTMAASTAIVTFPGVQAWITNDPTALAASFYGVVRASNQEELAGWVLSGAGLNIQQAVNVLMQSIGNFSGANPDVCVMSYSNYGKLLTILDSKARNLQTKGDGITVYYDGIELYGPTGKIMVHPSSFCPSDKVFVLDSSTWTVGAPDNKIIQNASPNGAYVELSGSDAVEVRQRAAGVVSCSFPGANGYITVSA